MKSLLIPLAFLSLASLVVGQGCDNTVAGSFSGVICVSKSQYVFVWEDSVTATLRNCRNGTVCADVADICSNSSEPVCNNNNPLTPGTCNKCIGKKPHLVCISATSYSVCNQGVVLTSMAESCPSSTPYCKAVFDTTADETQVIRICQTDAANPDCSGAGMTPNSPPPGNFTQTEAGFFADPSSTN